TYEYSSSTRYDMLIDGSDVSAIIPGNLPNPNVTWEVARTWNVGLDGSIMNGLFAWEVEYFQTRRSNILCKRNASIPYYSGLVGNLPSENIGIVSNRGVEVQMHHSNRVGDFIYNISGNFMYVRNRIEYMDETPWGEGYERMNQTGRPMNAGLYYRAIGINKTQ
ncbi:MAG: TonB-dependent receptor, partial [Bacteroidales bacterium]|nr:TonB-dependent receptor [Bacteroidales bacterium]